MFDVVAVDRIDLRVVDGEFFATLGPSGSGNTTTLRMIAGFDLPTEGVVRLHGDDVTRRAAIVTRIALSFHRRGTGVSGDARPGMRDTRCLR